jgi:hypothetical protein
MTVGRIAAGFAMVAALAAGACASQPPTFAEPGLGDPPAPRDTTQLAVPNAPRL